MFELLFIFIFCGLFFVGILKFLLWIDNLHDRRELQRDEEAFWAYVLYSNYSEAFRIAYWMRCGTTRARLLHEWDKHFSGYEIWIEQPNGNRIRLR